MSPFWHSWKAPLRNEGRRLCYLCRVVFGDAARAGVPYDPPAGRDDPPSFDTSVAHQARIYDYWLGGKDNYAADREAAEAAIAAYPGVASGARANRQFLARAVRHLASEAGIRQFLDIGTGIPTANNTHEVAQSAAPESRVVYVDHDPIVLVHARALLSSSNAGLIDYLDATCATPRRSWNGRRGYWTSPARWRSC